MVKSINIKQFINQAKQSPVIDVRSPKEFENGHIPGAVNIPLFSNVERAKVGTTYKQSGREQAILLGLEIVAPKMTGFVKKVERVAHGTWRMAHGVPPPCAMRHVLLYCWRGGMRSENFAWLLDLAGFEVFTLKDGYKSFRKFVLENFDRKANLIVLGGMTGSGKTDILNQLALLGEQVLNLEHLAHHKGSAFGAIGQNSQPTTECFENKIFEFWQKFDLSKPVWVEDESHNLGKVHIPAGLWLQMRNSPVIKIEIQKMIRAKRLVKEYACFDDNLLENAILKIGKRLGGLNTKKSLEALGKQDYLSVAQLTLTYYDKAYNIGLSKRQSRSVFPLSLDTEDPKENARKVMMFYKKIK
ncbi:MAG: tRNA 2-selenouridine(34) synthase MnmH [Cytophagales bacterium]|nr:tRNA 2-selenouridine(34) synthase MnmH [Cytophagales bacterium]